MDKRVARLIAGLYVRTVFDTMQISGSYAIAGWQRGRNRLIYGLSASMGWLQKAFLSFVDYANQDIMTCRRRNYHNLYTPSLSASEEKLKCIVIIKRFSYHHLHQSHR